MTSSYIAFEDDNFNVWRQYIYLYTMNSLKLRNGTNCCLILRDQLNEITLNINIKLIWWF